jgi:hypothetical protein
VSANLLSESNQGSNEVFRWVSSTVLKDGLGLVSPEDFADAVGSSSNFHGLLAVVGDLGCLRAGSERWHEPLLRFLLCKDLDTSPS